MNAHEKSPAMTPVEEVWLTECLTRGQYEMFHQIVAITPGIAGALLRHNTNNRPFSSGRSEKYGAMIKEGRWRVTPEAILVSKDKVLLDGQHRLGGVVLAGNSAEMMIWFGCDPSMFQVVNTGAIRTTGQIASLAGYTNSNVRAAIAGHIARMNFGAKIDSNLIFKTLEENSDEVMDEAIKFGTNARTAKICNQSAAAFAYWYISKESKHLGKFEEFKRGFLTGADLSEKSPILRVRKLLNTINANNGHQLVVKQAAAIILAWNCFVCGKYLNSIMWDHAIKMPVCA